jgi:hypothetical protein
VSGFPDGFWGKIAQGHVFDHAAAQWCHGWLIRK